MCPHLFGITGVALNSMFVCCYLSIVNHAGHMISPYPVMFPSTLRLVFVSDLHRSNDVKMQLVVIAAAQWFLYYDVVYEFFL